MNHEPENLTLAFLRKIDPKVESLRGEMAQMREKMATKDDIADLRSEIRSLRADVASDIMILEKRRGDQVAALWRAV